MLDKQTQLKVIINPKNLSPRKDGAPCELCTRNVAQLTYHVWDSAGKEELSSHPVCSLCMLYESPWGQKRGPQIAEVIEDLEKGLSHRFMRGVDGRLLLCSEANLVMGSIGLSSKLLFAMNEGEILPEQVYALMADVTDVGSEVAVAGSTPWFTPAQPFKTQDLIPDPANPNAFPTLDDILARPTDKKDEN